MIELIVRRMAFTEVQVATKSMAACSESVAPGFDSIDDDPGHSLLDPDADLADVADLAYDAQTDTMREKKRAAPAFNEMMAMEVPSYYVNATNTHSVVALPRYRYSQLSTHDRGHCCPVEAVLASRAQVDRE